MKPSRIILPVLFAATLVGGTLAGTAEARPHHGMGYGYGCNGYDGDGYGYGYGCYGGGYRGHWGGYGYGRGLSPEQRAKYSALIDEYAPKMRPVRDQIFVKRQELSALRNAANPDVKAVRNTAEELVKLQDQMADLHNELAARLEKEVGAPQWRDGDRPGPDDRPMPPRGYRHY